MKKVKYVVGKNEDFGLYGQPGDVFDAYLVCSDGCIALLYHPQANDEECASVSMCKPTNYRETRYEAIDEGHTSYINLPKKYAEMFERILKNEQRRAKKNRK